MLFYFGLDTLSILCGGVFFLEARVNNYFTYLAPYTPCKRIPAVPPAELKPVSVLIN